MGLYVVMCSVSSVFFIDLSGLFVLDWSPANCNAHVKLNLSTYIYIQLGSQVPWQRSRKQEMNYEWIILYNGRDTQYHGTKSMSVY